MRYLAIDYGAKRIGLAICDPDEIVVSPLCQLGARPDRPTLLFSRIAQIIDENQVQAVVVGLPLNMDDSEGPQAASTRQFARRLADAVGVPLHMFDERLSSAAADEILLQTDFTKKKRQKRRDMLAACAILQDFLHHKNSKDTDKA